MTLEDRELDRRLAALARKAEPGSDHWPAIEQRIRAPRRWAAPVAASAAAALVLTVAALRLVGPGPDQNDATGIQAVVSAEARAMQASAPGAPVMARLDSPEALMQAWSDNQNAIDEIEDALARDPGNSLLLEFLAEARLRQARLVNAGLTLSHQPRTTL